MCFIHFTVKLCTQEWDLLYRTPVVWRNQYPSSPSIKDFIEYTNTSLMELELKWSHLPG